MRVEFINSYKEILQAKEFNHEEKYNYTRGI